MRGIRHRYFDLAVGTRVTVGLRETYWSIGGKVIQTAYADQVIFTCDTKQPNFAPLSGAEDPLEGMGEGQQWQNDQANRR